MSDGRSGRTFYRPTPQLIQFVDDVLARRGWTATGTTSAARAIIEHNGLKNLLIDERGKEYNDQSLYELIRRRIEAHGKVEPQVKLVPAPTQNGSLDSSLLSLMNQLTAKLWILCDKGDADTLRDILALLK